MLETRIATGELRHRAPTVDHRDQCLRTLDRLFPRDESPMSRRGLPVEHARIVTGHVVSQPGECRSFAALLERADSGIAQPMLQREEPESPHVGE